MEQRFDWYIDITPNEMFSLYDIHGKRGIPLCQEHGHQLEMKEVVVIDSQATSKQPPDHCWACGE
jgi:hypothetical protein